MSHKHYEEELAALQLALVRTQQAAQASGERIVLVLTAAMHRRAAFEAAEFVMDFLKTRAPFWKREHLSDGTRGAWVAATSTDADAARQWDDPDP